jgi:hypothetical protein
MLRQQGSARVGCVSQPSDVGSRRTDARCLHNGRQVGVAQRVGEDAVEFLRDRIDRAVQNLSEHHQSMFPPASIELGGHFLIARDHGVQDMVEVGVDGLCWSNDQLLETRRIVGPARTGSRRC